MVENIQDKSTNNDTNEEKEPLLVMKLSTYPSKVEPSEAFESFGGVESYNDEYNHLAWKMDSLSSAEDLLSSAIQKYSNEEEARKWLDFINDKIDSAQIPLNGIERFSFSYFNDDLNYDVYAKIEESWIENHQFSEHVNQFEKSVGKLTAMKGATRKEWNDAFILNMQSPQALGDRMHYSRNSNLIDEWNELIDDIMLIYMGIQIYVGIRKFGSVEAYSI
jgi:hypothetical protein